MLLPSLLYSYMGFAPMKNLSLSAALSVMTLLQGTEPLGSLCAAGAVFLAVSGGVVFALCVRFRVRGRQKHRAKGRAGEAGGKSK